MASRHLFASRVCRIDRDDPCRRFRVVAIGRDMDAAASEAEVLVTRRGQAAILQPESEHKQVCEDLSRHDV